MAKKKRKPMPSVEFTLPIEIFHQDDQLSVELWNEPDGPTVLVIVGAATIRVPIQKRLRRTAS